MFFYKEAFVRNDNERYNEYVKSVTPLSSTIKSLFHAFLMGGSICLIGQIIAEIYHLILPNLDIKIVEEKYEYQNEVIFGDLKNNYILNSDNPYIGVTQSKCDDGYIVTAINYSDKPQKFDCNANIDYNVTVLYGDTSKDIPACDALILKLINK